jgi:SAM-dependent methyltransferase
MQDHDMLPFSPACERNKQVIFEHLRRWLPRQKRVLEIGSGTGQHAVWFHQQHAGWHWQCADQGDYLPGLKARLQQQAPSLPPAKAFCLGRDEWPDAQAEVVFSANTLHILSASLGDLLCQLADRHLPPNGEVIFYGPFAQAGQALATSNARFDEQLRAQGYGGIRSLESISQALGKEWILADQERMPANNQMLRFVRCR